MNLCAASYEQLLSKIVDDLLDPSSARSWTLVVPPGCGEAYVPAQLVERLKKHATKPHIAAVKADRIRRKSELLNELSRQWGDNGTRHTPNISDRPEAGIKDVLSALDRGERKRILVISRFHRILEWIDESILQDLREA